MLTEFYWKCSCNFIKAKIKHWGDFSIPQIYFKIVEKVNIIVCEFLPHELRNGHKNS